MMRASLQVSIEWPRWWYRLFTCKHEVASVTEGSDSRYGTHTSYLMCLKCGRKAMDIERNCKHQVDIFGRCNFCRARITKSDCKHKWTQEPDTDDHYCENCGEWKDIVDL